MSDQISTDDFFSFNARRPQLMTYIEVTNAKIFPKCKTALVAMNRSGQIALKFKDNDDNNVEDYTLWRYVYRQKNSYRIKKTYK